MSKDKLKEIDRLEKVIDHSLSFDLDELDFTDELALIRIIEEVGGIAKDLVRSGIDLESINKEWRYAIRTRDKISHSYESLNMEPIKAAITNMKELKSDIAAIRDLVSK